MGLTGPFGSGCTTIRKILEQEPFLFKGFSLSDPVRDTWKERNPGKSPEVSKRRELQDIGNELRQRNDDSAYCAKKAAEKARQTTTEKDSLVFDSIRNAAEVEYLRTTYPNFYLIGVCCSEKADGIGSRMSTNEESCSTRISRLMNREIRTKRAYLSDNKWGFACTRLMC